MAAGCTRTSIHTTFPPKIDQMNWALFVACLMYFSCFLAIPCSENSVLLEKKNWSQKASQNMQKASHIIKLPQCPFPNHIFTAVHTRFTRILACACIFRLGLYVDLHGAGLKNNFGGQKIEKNSIFLLLHKLVRKGFPHHPHHFFAENRSICPPMEPNLRPL